MYIKLALRNLRRSARDYGIYFLTVAVTVALMESFLALACARDVLSLSENMGILTTGIVGVSVLVALLSSCVIAYGVGFMLGQRKQEFALYQLMGMELRTVQRMFFWENGLLGLAAFGLGRCWERDWRESWPKGYGGFFRRPISTRWWPRPRRWG